MHPKTNTRPQTLDPLVVASEASELAEQTVLIQAPDAAALARPAGTDHLWVEDEYNELESEQEPLWYAAGEDAVLSPESTVAGLTLASEAAEFLVRSHRDLVMAAQSRLIQTEEALAPFRRRANGAKVWYQLAKAGFLIGDTAGFAAAAIWLGEEISIALTLAASAAVATVAAGLVGTEVRDLRGRHLRHRPADELTEGQRRFTHLFADEDTGTPILKRVMVASLSTASMIGLGIGALRAAVDDPLVGLVFGGIALAVAGGSFLVSYAGADEVADLIDHAHADYLKAAGEHTRLSESSTWRERAEAEARVGNLRAEHAKRGDAARHHVRALKWRVLRQNPQIAGHGPADPSYASTVGRTSRRDDA